MTRDKYNVVGFGNNFFITKGSPLSESQQFNHFHFKTPEDAVKYIRDILEPLDRELAEGPIIGTGEDF